MTSILSTISDMHAWAQETRARGERIAFVPTMGCLHEGHCALLREGRKLGDQKLGSKLPCFIPGNQNKTGPRGAEFSRDKLVLSIFVNPTQFGPNEDFSRYPRTFEADLAHARDCGVDVVFAPTVEEMYPKSVHPSTSSGRTDSWFDALTTNGAASLCNQLCGKFRPGHFQGVATVVAKLFQITQPHVALFGEKDFQQLQIIRRMVADLNIPVEVVGCPIVREPDGLAMSSRNTYLSDEDRQRALVLSQALKVAAVMVAAGDHHPEKLCQTVTDMLTAIEARIDYVTLADADTLEPLTQWKTPAVLAIATWIGKTRLIDNILFRK